MKNKIVIISSVFLAFLLIANVSASNEPQRPSGAFLLAGVILGDNGAPTTSTSFDSQLEDATQQEESKTDSGVKIRPTNASNKIISQLEALQDQEEVNNVNLNTNKKNTSGKKNTPLQIKEDKKEKLIEGYKLGHDGKSSVYVHGEIIESKNGDVSGYLYDKKGKKTYVYGQIKDNNDREFRAKDGESSDYILEAK